jgi:hypothetical protein
MKTLYTLFYVNYNHQIIIIINCTIKDALDSDEQRLQDQHGRVAKRDIVQFVKFNDFVKGASSSGA